MTDLPQETELKLWLHPDDVVAFERHPRLARARAVRQRLVTRYFDTPDFRLANKGIALRVRRVGRRWLQTLKTEGGQGGGLSTRLELETPVAGPAPDLSRLPAKLVDRLIPRKRRASLVAVYETRFTRTAWRLRAADGSRVEVALDVGEICAGRRKAPLCEVELELKAGSPDALYALAMTLAQRCLLLPFAASKAARGAQLAAGAAPQPVKAESPRLDRKMSPCQGFVAILRADLAQLLANLPGVLTDPDPEYCHQARVAIRRLRSAVRLFRKVCALPAERLAEIAALGDALGEARDADVLVLETLPRLQAVVPEQHYRVLLRRAARQRRDRRAAMLSVLRAPATGACLIALEDALNRLDARASRGRLRTFAAGRLSRLFDRVAPAAARFAELAPEARHALRVQVKRLRYACEHFSSLLPPEKSFQSALARIQDGLGLLNDQVVALRDIARLNTDGRLDAALQAVRRWAEAENRARLPVLAKDLQLFSRKRPSW